MIQGKPFDDSRTQPPFYREPEPQIDCAAKCGYKAWTPEEMGECVVCKKRFCRDCLREMSGEKLCQACAVCACGQPALIACDECSSLVCERHVAIDPLNNECLKCRRSGPDPDDPPAEAYDPNDFVDQVRS